MPRPSTGAVKTSAADGCSRRRVSPSAPSPFDELSKKSIIAHKTTRFSSRQAATIMLSMETRLRRQEGNAEDAGKRSVFERFEHY
jgi:hypothetical protein